jgi:hypothetical protein
MPAENESAQTFYLSQSWSPWLYVHDGKTWHVYASDGTWVQDQRRLSKETLVGLKEITKVEGEALLTAGRVKTIDVEPPLRPHSVPPWKAPMLCLRWVAGAVFIGAVFVFRATTQHLVEEEPAWHWAVYVALCLLIPIVLFLLQRRSKRRYKL